MKFFSNVKSYYLRRVWTPIALIYGLVLLGLLQYASQKGPSNAGVVTKRTTPQLPTDPYIVSGLRGAKVPMESMPEDPHLCILVSTYKCHSVKLITLLSSIFVTDYPHMKAILLDTDKVIDSTAWMEDMANVVNGIFQREYVVTANITQRDMLRKYTKKETGVRDDFGYILSDEVMSDILEERDLARELNDTKLECDYFMLTNGDNLYGPEMMPALLHYMRENYDIVGFDFTSRYPHGESKIIDPERTFKTRRKDQQVGLEPIEVHNKTVQLPSLAF